MLYGLTSAVIIPDKQGKSQAWCAKCLHPHTTHVQRYTYTSFTPLLDLGKMLGGLPTSLGCSGSRLHGGGLAQRRAAFSIIRS